MPDQEWYRSWRHDELALDEREAHDARFRRREAAKRIIGDLCIVGAIVAFAWSMMPA